MASIAAGAACCPRNGPPVVIQPAASTSGNAGRNPTAIHLRSNVPALATHRHRKTPIPPSYLTTAIATCHSHPWRCSGRPHFLLRASIFRSTLTRSTEVRPPLRTILATLLLVLASTPLQFASAQTAEAPTRKPTVTGKSSATVPAKNATPASCACSPAMQVHIRPYIDMGDMTEVQTRADGTTITTVTPTQEWRDDAGREREDITRTLRDGTRYRDISVYDPIEQVRMAWSVGKPNTPDVVTVYPFPSSETTRPAPPPAPVNPQPTQRPYYLTRTESLPPQTIAGLYAEGTLTTTITPAGARGNDYDIVYTQETWTSPDTGIQLRNITDDPPRPKIGAEMTDIQFVGPDPAVFKAPEGYELKYATPMPPPGAAPACNCTTPTVTPQHFKPYSYKVQTTRVQTLADGTHITTVSTAQMWRDADGHTRTESYNTVSGGALGRSVSIYDPVARVRMNWVAGDSNVPKVVNIQHYPRPAVQPASPAPVNPQPVQHRYYPTRTESLPPQTIDGLYATGSRITRTIPAGYEGNDRDMTTVTEYWTAPDLGIQLRRITDDPRDGKTTTEVTDVQQTAPDPALFQPPAGYTIHDTNPQ